MTNFGDYCLLKSSAFVLDLGDCVLEPGACLLDLDDCVLEPGACLLDLSDCVLESGARVLDHSDCVSEPGDCDIIDDSSINVDNIFLSEIIKEFENAKKIDDSIKIFHKLRKYISLSVVEYLHFYNDDFFKSLLYLQLTIIPQKLMIDDITVVVFNHKFDDGQYGYKKSYKMTGQKYIKPDDILFNATGKGFDTLPHSLSLQYREYEYYSYDHDEKNINNDDLFKNGDMREYKTSYTFVEDEAKSAKILFGNKIKESSKIDDFVFNLSYNYYHYFGITADETLIKKMFEHWE
jgi:hypothetical protein